MAFAIEVPGEATPLDPASLRATLSNAVSIDNSRRRSATQQLEAWENHTGYYSSLQDAFFDKSLTNDARLMAIIQLKNGIDKHWRVLGQSNQALTVPEKLLIRQRMFQGTVDEPDGTLALHNALVVAKIIRHEFPASFPDAISQIIDLLRSCADGDAERLFGVLQLVLPVTKELLSARMKWTQEAFQRASPELLLLLCQIYSNKSTLWMNLLAAGQQHETQCGQAMRLSLLALRITRRLMAADCADAPSDDSNVEQFWAASQSQFGQLLNLTTSQSPTSQDGPYADMIDRHLIQLAKLHYNMAEVHPASFCALPNSISLVHAYWDLVAKFATNFAKSEGIRQGPANPGTSKAKVQGPLQERLALRGLLLLRICVRITFGGIQSLRYRTAEKKARQEAAQETLRSHLFKDDFVVQLVQCITNHLLVFRRADLEAWEEDPEEWEHQEQIDGAAWEWEVRPCAEKLFLDLLTNFKNLLIPPLLTYFQIAHDPQAEMAMKEAVYTAMGLAAAHVYKSFSFTDVLASAIVRDAQQEGPLCKVLRRRILILISQWAPVQMTSSNRSIAYQIFQHFLNPSVPTNDVVVRITAARQLKWIVDEVYFELDLFLPFASDILKQLVDLIKDVEIDETKLAILESVRLLVARMEDRTAILGDQIMSALPEVWHKSGEQGNYMIKQSIVAIFAALVLSMGPEAQRYQGLMIPLLSQAAQPESDLHHPLIDDSVELWSAILMQSSAPLEPGLLDLAVLALPLIEYSAPTSNAAMEIVESYILHAPEAVLDDKLRRPLLSGLAGVAGPSKNRDLGKGAIVCIEYLIRAAAELGGGGGISVVVEDLYAVGFLESMLTSIMGAYEARTTVGRERKTSYLHPLTMGDYLSILSRIALADPDQFARVLTLAGDEQKVWSWLSSEWFEYIRAHDNIERQKLFLLGLTRLLELPSPRMQELVLGSLQDYFVMWTTVIGDLQEGKAEGGDALLRMEAEVPEYDTPKSVKTRQMMNKDPVYSVDALAFVTPRLRGLVERTGGQAVFEEQWAVNVDKQVLMGFRAITERVAL